MSPNPPDNSPAPIGPGSRVDKFEIIEQIGAGGSSIVWKAHDRLLNQFVAVKQVSPEGDIDDELRDRFRAETRMQKRIASQHRHLVRIIDVIDEQRGLFIVMEFVDGPSLEQLLAQRRKPLDQRHALGIIAATAVALEAIHKQNVVHRDLKPSNILLPKSGGLKVCDFGLAVMSDVQEQMSIGTVRYMAPEMFLNETLDGRADIYALGMIAYEMLVGREQFENAFKLVLRDQRNQALRWMKWHTNPRATATPVHQLNREVPETLGELVARMMEKDRDRRISSAGEIIEAIRRHFAGEPIGREQLEAAQQQPAGDDNPTAAVPRQSRMKLLLTVNLLILAVLTVGFFAMQGMEAAGEQREVFEQAVQRYDEASERMDDLLDPAAGEMDLAEMGGLMETYNELARTWPSDVWLSNWSLVRATALAAYIERESGNLGRAIELFRQAENRSLEVRTDEAMPVDVDTMIRERRRLQSRRALHDKFDELAREGARLAAASRDDEREHREWVERLDRLEREIDEFTDWDTYRDLRPQFEPKVSRLRSRLGDIRDTTWISTRLDRARRHMEADNFSAARSVLEEIEDSDVRPDDEQRRQMSQLRQRMDREDTVREARQRADDALADAENQPDNPTLWQNVIRAYEGWIEVEPDRAEALEDDIERFRANRHFAEGLRLLERDPSAAREAFVRARDLGHGVAQTRIDQIDEGLDREARMSEGRRALEDGRYQQAIDALTAAQAIRAGDDVERLLRESRIGLAMERGREALEQRRLEQARRELERVVELDPNNDQAPRLLDEVARWESYMRHKEAGDEAMRNRDFGTARSAFRRARDYFETSQIEDRIRDAGYEAWMRAAREHVQRSEWDQARAALRQAISNKSTDEAADLLDEVEQRLQEE